MSKSTRILKIASYLPSDVVDSMERARKFGYERDFLEQKLGTTSLTVKPPGTAASDMCVEATKALGLPEDELSKVGLVVVCTQTPDGHGIPHTSAIVHRKLKLAETCACFDISLGCSGYVYGLAVVTAFMDAQGIRRGLFFTSDPYSEIVDPEDQATSLLFGDASTVTLLGAEGPGWMLTDAVFATQGTGGDAINNYSGKLAMDGRGVFNFAMTAVPKQIRSLFEKCGGSLEEMDLVVLHQGSRYIVDKLRERLKLPAEKVPVHLDGIGNSVSSAIPLTLEAALREHPDAKRVLISGFGVGLSYATGILQSCE